MIRTGDNQLLDLSEFEGRVRVELLVEVLLLLVLETGVVMLCLLQTLGKGLPEYIIGQHSLPKSSIAGQWVAQLHIILTILLNHLSIRPLTILILQCLPKLFCLRKGELIYLLRRGYICWLNMGGIHTSTTYIFVLGTPTISAAVLCNISEGGMLVSVCVDTYLWRV